MTEQQKHCRNCPKPISARSKGLCKACAARLSGKRFGKPNRIIYETAQQKQDRLPTSSWWTTPASFQEHASERAKRMAGNGWEV
jgi:NMD protein affecting ribosome stability and mRNA decay